MECKTTLGSEKWGHFILLLRCGVLVIHVNHVELYQRPFESQIKPTELINPYLVSIYIMNRTEKPPERAYALQKYLLLHSQHEALQCQQQRRGSISNAQLVGPSTMTRRPSLSALNDESVLGEIEYSENKLINVTEQIKCTLTDLLNSEGVKDDSRYRTWVQNRFDERG